MEHQTTNQGAAPAHHAGHADHAAQARQPGMMLLIGLAITVAFTASLATSLHVSSFDLDFWRELALLIDVMLLGHWLEMKAIGRLPSPFLVWRAGLRAEIPSRRSRCRGTTPTRLPGV